MFNVDLKEKLKTLSALTSSQSPLAQWQKEMQDEPIPNRSNEDWRYADLSFLEKGNFKFVESQEANLVEYDAQLKKLRITVRSDSPTAVVHITSLCKGVQVFSRRDFANYAQASAIHKSLNHEWSYSNFFDSATYSLASHNLLVTFSSMMDEDVSVDIIFDMKNLKPDSVMGPHVICHVQPGATVKMTERYILAEKSLMISGVDYFIGENADAECLKLETIKTEGCHIHTSKYSLAKDARLKVVTLTQESFWSRHNCFIELTQAGAHADLLGAYTAYETNFVDHHTWIDHQVEHTTSSQEYHGVVTGKARAVFNGKIKIHKDAQKSSTSQINKNLLLSSTAEVDTKPELMIYADDVKASHGATIGQIQKDELFYLLSRGLTASKAKELLCAGFLNSIGESLSENLQEEFRLSVSRSLAKIVEG